MNTPISQRSEEIVKKYNIKVIPFRLLDFGAEFQSYHPSTLRWVMMDNFFQVRQSLDSTCSSKSFTFVGTLFAQIEQYE